MRVLLREKVDKLGNPGDIVDVASGYARNYLLPCNVAVEVSDENIRKIQKEQEQCRQEMETKVCETLGNSPSQISTTFLHCTPGSISRMLLQASSQAWHITHRSASK